MLDIIGVLNDHILAFYDMMPTLSELAGVENYAERYCNPMAEVDYFDGVSFAPTLLGEGEQPKHEYLYWEFEESDQVAVRMGDYARPWGSTAVYGRWVAVSARSLTMVDCHGIA